MPKVILFFFSLFFIAGNFFRLLPIKGFPSHFSLVEVFLYLSTLSLYFSKPRKSHLLVAFLLLSISMGILLNGFHLPSVLYGVKLIAMIGCGVVVGEMVHKNYAEEGLVFFLRVFVYNLLFGVLIYFVFPHSAAFFLALKGYGVHFVGDPHIQRFISPFFDPNYYSAIACIPLLLALHFKRFPLAILILVCLIATWSRSGIVTAFALFSWIALSAAAKLKFLHIRPIRLLSPLLFLFLPYFFSEEFSIFFERFRLMTEDVSALNRLYTFEIGLLFLLKHPFFGIGYNFLAAPLMTDFQRPNIDSSPLITLIAFGLIPTIAFLSYGVIWLWKSYPFFPKIFRRLSIYLCICILFTSQFNNLLYYQFWVIPMIALFTYAKLEYRIRS